jgi:hypothetical protein
LARRYLLDEAGHLPQKFARKNTKKITLLENENSLANYDDELFVRSDEIDFVFRIEEVGLLTKILSLIS